MRIFLLSLVFLISCSGGLVKDPAAFAASESNFKSLKFLGCNASKPESFTVCYGKHGEPVTDQIQLILPPVMSQVEVICGNYNREFEASTEAILELSDIYGEFWDVDRTCILSVFVKTKLKDMVAFYEAEALVYSYDRGFIPNAPDSAMAWECSVKYSTKGRVSVKCGKL